MASSPRRGHVLGVTMIVALMGCAVGPSFEEYLTTVKSAGGTNAQDCGVVRRSESDKIALACASDALAQNRSFIAVFERRGIDSQVFASVVGNERGELWRISWDSDMTGGAGGNPWPKRRIFRTVCERAWSDTIAKCINS